MINVSKHAKKLEVLVLNPVAQVLTVDNPISHPSGICALPNRVACALSSGTYSPLSPA